LSTAEIPQKARIQQFLLPQGRQLKRISIGESGVFQIASEDLPTPINRSVFDIIDIVATITPGVLLLQPKQPPTVTTEEFGPGVILQVEPKYGTSSLIRLLILADEPGMTLSDQQVWYGLEANVTILEVLAFRLLERLEEIEKLGWIGADIERVTDGGFVEGEILLFDSLLASIRRGEIVLTQRVSHFSFDIPINQIIITTLTFLSGSSHSLSMGVNVKLAEILAGAPRISPRRDAADAAILCRAFLERDHVPPNREYYLPILQLCLLLLERFALTQSGAPELEHPPLRLVMSSIFERMIRNVVAQAIAPNHLVRSGKEDLLLGGRNLIYTQAEPPSFNISMEPDLVIRSSRDLQHVSAVFDVKYKFGLSNNDHYQLNAYVSRFHVSKAGFITLGQPDSPVLRARLADGTTVVSFGFDLTDIQAEVVRLQKWMRELLEY